MSLFPKTPSRLLARIAVESTNQTDELAWRSLFELYEPAIRRFVALQDALVEGEDVVQDIFLKLVKVLRKGIYISSKGRFRAYLATLIRNELISMWRKRKVRGADANVSIESLKPEREPFVESMTEREIDAKWRLARHAAAVDHVLTKTALAQKSKDIYRAYVLDERPIGEVAAQFGVDHNVVSQVKTRIEKMIAAIEAEYAD